MTGNFRKQNILLFAALVAALLLSAGSALAQYYQSQLAPPPPAPVPASADAKKAPADSIGLHFKVRPTVPQTYDDLKTGEYAADLKTPSNITTTAEYDYESGCYVIHTKVGDNDIVTPFMLSPA